MPAGVAVEGTWAPTSLRIIPEMHACLFKSLSDGALHHCLPYSIRQQNLIPAAQVQPWPVAWTLCHHAICQEIILASKAHPDVRLSLAFGCLCAGCNVRPPHREVTSCCSPSSRLPPGTVHMPIAGAFARLTRSTSAAGVPVCLPAHFLSITTPMPTCGVQQLISCSDCTHGNRPCYHRTFALLRHNETQVASVEK